MRSEEAIRARLNNFNKETSKLFKPTSSIGGFLGNLTLIAAKSVAIAELKWVLEEEEKKEEKK